ncbi:ENT domain-containing protein [Heracleum sosnowskyi]|uniref:ENT domain-containing protein n=1 Tax=Heracleum sosnowskyi TaxID=360622 RepID=A0AAD8MRI9_9APIA|nr:ENT domain-containing protein [Heracleum sosnowskyi]
MRFERGSKVEVLKQVDALTAWRGAEIVSGDRNTYSVRYNCYIPEHGVDTERVPRKLIRPTPPVHRVESWVAGDVVEVFDNVMWKIAIISNVRGAYCIVRLLGSSYKFRVHMSDIRVRQCWQNDQWFLMGKGSGTSDCYQKMSFEAAQTDKALRLLKEDALLAAQNNTGLQGSHLASSRTLKRGSPYYSSLLQANSRNVKKIRASDKADQRYQVLPVCVDQVHDVAYPRENQGEMCVHASFNNKTNGHNEFDRGLNDFIGCSVARDIENNDSDTDICSVGSCSAISRTLSKFSTHMLAVPCQETHSNSSDAESHCGTRNDKGCDLPPEDCFSASEIQWAEVLGALQSLLPMIIAMMLDLGC